MRKIDTAGTIYHVAGTGVAGFSGDTGVAASAMLSHPRGIAIDGLTGDIAIAGTLPVWVCGWVGGSAGGSVCASVCGGLWVWGSAGGSVCASVCLGLCAAASFMLSHPRGIAIDGLTADIAIAGTFPVWVCGWVGASVCVGLCLAASCQPRLATSSPSQGPPAWQDSGGMAA